MARKPNQPVTPTDPDSLDKQPPPPEKKKRRWLRFILGAIVVLFICGAISSLFTDDAAEDTEPTAEVVRSAATEETVEELAEQPTEQPTEEPQPTDTSVPTPRPSFTPRPTSTPRPTATPEPMEPILLSGTGDSIVDVELTGDPSIIHIVGNAAARHFAVVSLDAAGNTLDLLVNTTDPYDGVRPLDFLDSEHTARFEVSAVGPWEIEIRSLLEMPRAAVPGTFEGTGDAVFLLEAPADIATVTGNAAARHFAVHGYGGSIDLLVNTTDPYDGQVLISPQTRVIAVTASGDWSMDFTGR